MPDKTRLSSNSDTVASRTRSREETVLYTIEEVQKMVNEAVAASTERLMLSHNAKMAVLHRQIEAMEERLLRQESLYNKLEQYSRRSHLRIRGLVVPEGEDCKEAVADFVNKNLRSNGQPLPQIRAADIDAAHPLPIRKSKKTQQKDLESTDPKEPAAESSQPERTPRPMLIVRFHERDVRDRIIRARRSLKDSGFSIHEDLTSQNAALLNKLTKCSSVEAAWTWGGKVYARIRGQPKTQRFDIFDTLPM